MRKLIIAGNWKLNLTSQDAVELVTILNKEVGEVTNVDVIVCPVFTVLADIHDVLTESNIQLGAQNIFWEDDGAFTGEVSGPFLKDVGVKYAIIGHSERRQYFGETNEIVNKRIKAALGHDLTPIMCVGEILEEREADKTFDVIQKQIEEGLAGFSAEDVGKMIIAYEPVWAIGTGKTATPEQAQDVHKFIRGLLVKLYDEELASSVCIQYGGSVKPDNSIELMAQPDIDGALIGGASLKSESFVQIIKNCCDILK